MIPFVVSLVVCFLVVTVFFILVENSDQGFEETPTIPTIEVDTIWKSRFEAQERIVIVTDIDDAGIEYQWTWKGFVVKNRCKPTVFIDLYTPHQS